MSLPLISRENDALYLTQDLSGLNTYDKAKALVDFCDKETKIFEKEVDKRIAAIFEKNGINIPNTTKSVLKRAFERLNAKGKDIRVIDLYKDIGYMYQCELIKETNLFTIWLEDDYFLQIGIEVKEIDL